MPGIKHEMYSSVETSASTHRNGLYTILQIFANFTKFFKYGKPFLFRNKIFKNNFYLKSHFVLTYTSFVNRAVGWDVGINEKVQFIELYLIALNFYGF